MEGNFNLQRILGNMPGMAGVGDFRPRRTYEGPPR